VRGTEREKMSGRSIAVADIAAAANAMRETGKDGTRIFSNV